MISGSYEAHPEIYCRLTSTTENETRDVLHFHYTTWPDFGVPSCPDTFLEFLGAVRESGSLASDAGPRLEKFGLENLQHGLAAAARAAASRAAPRGRSSRTGTHSRIL